MDKDVQNLHEGKAAVLTSQDLSMLGQVTFDEIHDRIACKTFEVIPRFPAHDDDFAHVEQHANETSLAHDVGCLDGLMGYAR
jgi:hypothetical protein